MSSRPCLSPGCNRPITGTRKNGRPLLHGLCHSCYQVIRRERSKRGVSWLVIEQEGRASVCWHPSSKEAAELHRENCLPEGVDPSDG